MPLEREEFEAITEHLRNYGERGKEAIGTTHQLSDAMSFLFRVIGYGGGGGVLADFLNRLGLINKEGARLGPILFENSQQLHRFTAGLGLATGGAVEFLRAMDAVERKQSELNRAIGIGTVSITQYYHELVTATGMGGKAAKEAAEMTMKALTEQRMWTQKEIDTILPLFVKYSLGISKSFPQDFVFMHERLGMQLHQISDSYKTMGLNAAATSVPFELYKNVVFSLTEQIQRYGFTIKDAMAVTNLFTDDLKKGTITANEASSVMQTLSQAQMTGGGFSFRVKMAMFLSRAWGEVPTDIKETIESSVRQRFGEGAKFTTLGVLNQADLLQKNIPPGTFEKAWPYAARESMRPIPETSRAMLFPQMWPGFEYMAFINRLEPALKAGTEPFTKSIEDLKNPTEQLTEAIKALEKIMEESTKGMREWYYPLEQFTDWMKSMGLGGVAGAGEAVGGSLLAALPGALMTVLSLRMAGFRGGAGTAGGMAGGVAPYWGSMAGEAGVFETGAMAMTAGRMGMLGMSVGKATLTFGPMIAQMALFTADMWALDKIVKATSAGFELLKAKSEERKMHEEALKTTPGLTANIYDLERALIYKRMGEKKLMERALEEAGEEGLLSFLHLRGGLPEKLIETTLKERSEKYERIKKPGAESLTDIAKMAMVDVQRRRGEIIVNFKPIIISTEDSPTMFDLMRWPGR